MKSLIVKRSIEISGHKTSVSLEEAFWKIFGEIARTRHVTLSQLAAEIASERQHGNLSSAIRVFVLGSCRDPVLEHRRSAVRELLANATSLLAR